MADFDPLAATRDLNKFSLQMQGDNSALQRLMTQGGIQDVLARRENTDKMGQIEATGLNAIRQGLVNNKVPFDGLDRLVGNAGSDTSTALNLLRQNEMFKDRAAAEHAINQGGLFTTTTPTTTPIDLTNLDLPLRSGTPTGTQAALAGNVALVQKEGAEQTEDRVPNPLFPNDRSKDIITKRTGKETGETQTTTKATAKGSDPAVVGAKAAQTQQATQSAMQTKKGKLKDGTVVDYVEINGQKYIVPSTGK